MATGASTADVAILLVDARNGVRTQSRRHARIARLLGIPTSCWRSTRWTWWTSTGTSSTASWTTSTTCSAGAVGARHPDERAARRQRDHEQRPHALVRRAAAARVPGDRAACTATSTAAPFRFPVQIVVRPDDVFRGYAGQIVSGTVRAGDRVTAWPSGRSARVKRIVTFDGDLRPGVRADVGDADARRRDRHQPRRRADDGAAARRPAVRGRGGVDGRAAARSRAASTC